MFAVCTHTNCAFRICLETLLLIILIKVFFKPPIIFTRARASFYLKSVPNILFEKDKSFLFGPFKISTTKVYLRMKTTRVSSIEAYKYKHTGVHCIGSV